jgi:hypothetical protein
MSEQQKTMMRHVLDGSRTAPNGPLPDGVQVELKPLAH